MALSIVIAVDLVIDRFGFSEVWIENGVKGFFTTEDPEDFAEQQGG